MLSLPDLLLQGLRHAFFPLPRGPCSLPNTLCWKAPEAQLVVDRRLAGGSVCVYSVGELFHQRVLTGGPPNMQRGGCCMGADGMWEGFAKGNGQRWFMKD